MKYGLRNKFLSTPRINRYLKATDNHKERAKRLYNANIRLAQAFHPILTQFEVILRNSLNERLSLHFDDQDWIINQKNGFMNHPSLAKSNFFLKKSILKTERNLKVKRVSITSGKVISNQNFGFWLALFLSHHYKLVGGEPIQIFAQKPLTENRADLYRKLDDLRKFRNRTNHCEPLCFIGDSIDCGNALDIRNTLYDLVRWIEPELEPFLLSFDIIEGKINHIMKI